MDKDKDKDKDKVKDKVKDNDKGTYQQKQHPRAPVSAGWEGEEGGESGA